MEKIKSILTKEISKKGYISISRFMEISLTDPNEGYYINQKPLGKSGDFITSPDITQIFGEVIGAWAIDIIKGKKDILYDPTMSADHHYTPNGNTWKGIG